jgi:hypothetical protein
MSDSVVAGTGPADRAYKVFVRPLSLFLMFAGAVLLMVSGFVRLPIAGPFPFVESEAANRALFAAISALIIVLGVGLYRRSRLAWIGLFAYIGLGTVLTSLGMLFDPRLDELGWWPAVVGPVINGVFAVGIFLGTAPAFRSE